MRRTVLLALLFSLASVLPSLAQFGGQAPVEESFAYGDNYFLEVTGLPGVTPQKGRAVMSFRLTYDLLTFHRVTQTLQNGNFYEAVPTIYVEAVAADGVISDRGKWQDTAWAKDFSETNSRSAFIGGSIELALRPGVYTIKYTFDDGTPGSGFSESVNAFTMDDFSGATPAIGTPLFLRDLYGDTLTAASVDGNALFGRRLRAYIPLASAEPPKSLKFEIQAIPHPSAANRTAPPDPTVVQTGLGTILGGTTLSGAIPSGNDLHFAIRRGESVPAHAYGALIDVPTSDLDVGEYLLLLSYEAGSASVNDTVSFRLRWVDAPFSLSRVDYAIKALYPIVSDDSLDLLQAGDREQQGRALRAFWAKRDPTPSTKFNEAMAEYYRRVDYANANFKSLGQRDGTFTDRGKIFILYGPPTEVNRDLQPDAAPREVWLYHNKVKRGFVFTDPSKTGDYRLTEYYDL